MCDSQPCPRAGRPPRHPLNARARSRVVLPESHQNSNAAAPIIEKPSHHPSTRPPVHQSTRPSIHLLTITITISGAVELRLEIFQFEPFEIGFESRIDEFIAKISFRREEIFSKEITLDAIVSAISGITKRPFGFELWALIRAYGAKSGIPDQRAIQIIAHAASSARDLVCSQRNLSLATPIYRPTRI